MIEELEKYAEAIGANQEVKDWLATTGKKVMATLEDSTAEIEHVLDFFVSMAAPRRLQKMSFADAKRKAAEWSEANKKKGRDLVDGPDDIEVLYEFQDRSFIVKLKTKKAFQREGFLMNHCAGGYSPDSVDQLIYSYRDANNIPHATFEVRKKNNEIVQIKGKGNGPIHPKYVHPILEFLKTIGMEVRTKDMVNLGYHYIHGDHVDFIKRSPAASKQLAVINGEAYAF